MFERGDVCLVRRTLSLRQVQQEPTRKIMLLCKEAFSRAWALCACKVFCFQVTLAHVTASGPPLLMCDRMWFPSIGDRWHRCSETLKSMSSVNCRQKPVGCVHMSARAIGDSSTCSLLCIVFGN